MALLHLSPSTLVGRIIIRRSTALALLIIVRGLFVIVCRFLVVLIALIDDGINEVCVGSCARSVRLRVEVRWMCSSGVAYDLRVLGMIVFILVVRSMERRSILILLLRCDLPACI